MIHAYNKIYLNTVMHNIAALFDIAINAEGLDADEFANKFINSNVASGIEKGYPTMLVGKSATEMLMIILDKNIEFTLIPTERTREYWAGWILAIAQWYLNKSFKEIISVMPISKLISLYNPYHEADEMKTVELIREKFPFKSNLKLIRKERKLTQEQLAYLSGVNIRSIRAYEQNEYDILKAQAETLYMLAKVLNCSIGDLL